MGSATGSKWVFGIVLYFIAFITIVTLVNSIAGGGTTLKDYGLNEKTHCDNPRVIFYPYSVFKYESSEMNDLSSLECSKTAGVLSKTKCESIEGCFWGEETITAEGGSAFENFFSWIRSISSNVADTFYNDSVNELAKNTCYGNIDAEHYGIETFTDVFNTQYVASHENTGGLIQNKGSICNHPLVYNDSDKCSLFSCLWAGEYRTGDLSIKDIEISEDIEKTPTMFKRIYRSIIQLVSFTYDFGFTDDYYNNLLSLILFYLPLLALALAIYMMIRG